MGWTSGLSGHGAASPRSFSWRETGVLQPDVQFKHAVRTNDDSLPYKYMNSHVCCWLASLLRNQASRRRWLCMRYTTQGGMTAAPSRTCNQASGVSHGSRGCAERGRDHRRPKPKPRRSLLCPARPCVANLVRAAPIPVSGHGSLQRAAPPPLVPRLQQRLPGREVVATWAHPQEPQTTPSIVYSGPTLFPPWRWPVGRSWRVAFLAACLVL